MNPEDPSTVTHTTSSCFEKTPVNSAFIRRLQKDPHATLQHIEELYDARLPGAHNKNLIKHLKCLTEASGSHEMLPRGTWPAETNRRLFDLYFNAVVAPGFFEEEPILVVLVVEGLLNLARECVDLDDIKTVRYMLLCCPVIFKKMWEHRDRLKALDISPKESVFEWCVFHWADMYQRNHDHLAGTRTYIPQVALYCWVHLSRPDGFSDMSLAGLRFIHGGDQPYYAPQMVERFAQEVVVDTLGGDSVLERFERTLIDCLDEERMDILIGSGEVVDALDFVTQLAKHHSGIRRLVHQQQSEKDDADVVWMEWESALFFWQLMFMDLEDAQDKMDMSNVTVRGDDIITFLARGTELISRGNPPDLYDLITGSLQLMGVYARAELCDIAPTLVDDLLRRTVTEWIPVLNILDMGFYRRRIPEDVYKKLRDAWMTFGSQVMNLDEDRERKRHQDAMQKFCSYPACQFYRKEPNVDLSSCSGCGGARYCGKECQRGDWKVHKKTCRKVVE
ncbi:unnamed protein product [Peniophora sp. CBMAI 1063]|nr:unnamed protein product [Peniophora sp. CBMAI 1063]